MYYVIETNCLEWDKYLNDIPLQYRDIYFTSEYYKLYELNGDGIGKMFIYEENGKTALYPFLLNEINDYGLGKKYYDIQTAYGYGGPISNCGDELFLKNFEECFLKYCTTSNIIAEFIRFHPLIKNERFFKENIEILHNRKTVYLKLEEDIQTIWNEDISIKCRNKIRKAKRNDLKVIENNDYKIFKQIYEETMDKVRATKEYYFHDKYYHEMSKNENFIIMNVLKDDLVIAASVFMIYGDYFHYHLSGTKKDYLKYASNNILLWEAIKFAQEKKCKFFHFGGGLKDSEEDSLYLFKKSFSKTTSDFYIGKRIHNENIYHYLIDKWEKKNGRKADLFLSYRY